jgi:hypothetical protein
LDYDLDGSIDIFMGNWYRNGVLTPDRLYQGHGDGSFTDVSVAAGIASATSAVYGVATVDWNDDGLPDLFAPSYSHTAAGSTPIHWMNNGDGTFSQVQGDTDYDLYRGYGSGKASFGSMFWDYDNDGDMDFLEILTHGVGDGAGQVHTTVVTNIDDVFSWDFERVFGRTAEDPDLTHHGDHYGTWFDMDHDGLWDFALTECGYSNNRIYIFQQSAGNTFSPVTPLTGLDAINTANLPPHNVMALDYDLDGDEDLLVGFASSDGIQLWRNDMTTTNSWLTVSLEGNGVGTNRSAIGARVHVTAAGTTWTREVFAGNGHMCPQMPLSQNFGLGTAWIVDTVKITWPNAAHTTTVKAGVSVNQFITARDADILATSFETGDLVGWSVVSP